MNFKTTYALFGILAVVVLAFIVTLWIGPSSTESSNYVLPTMHAASGPLKADDITRVEIDRTQPDAEKLVFVRDGDSKRWRIVEPRDYAADSSAIDNLVRQISSATLDPKADVVNKPKQYGLETPAEVVTLIKEGEPRREVKLNVGVASPGEASAVIYVTSSDRKEVMAVKKNDLDSVKKPLAAFRSHDLLTPASGDIQAFTLTQSSKEKVTKGPIELKKGSEERWAYVQPSYGDAQATGTDPVAADKPPSNVQSVLTDITNLRVENDKGFVKDDATDLGKYHLDKTKDDILRIAIERVEEIGKDSEGNKEKKTANLALLVGVGEKIGDNKDHYYAYVDDPKHNDIVEVPVKNVERFLKLLAKPDALRDRNLIALHGQPDAFDIKSDSWGLLEFRRAAASKLPVPSQPKASWKLWRGDKSYAVDDAAMQGLIGLLTAQNQVEGFVDDAAEKGKLGLDKPDAVVRIWADSLPAEDSKKNEEKDEKKDDKKEEKKDKKPEPKDKDKPAFTLSFGRLKEKSATVERKRGDEKNSTVVLVPGKVRDQVLEGPLAYLDKKLPPFNESPFDTTMKDVTKLTLTRDGTTYEMSREKKADAPWKIDKPSDFAGRTADSRTITDILNGLNTLRFVKIVADKAPADAKLAEWGLKEPALKAVVTLAKDDKPKTFEYDFGKEADDKSGVYLRTSHQDAFGIAANNVVNTLKRELQDSTVFQFDTAKVKEVKVTGWIALQKKRGINQPDVLDVKRDKNGSDWVVETPKGFNLDTGKLNNFLKELSALKATKFVAHKAKPSDTHGLDVAKDDGSLKIEITVEGEK
ncbi:MAG TPA: DUF4340 domain-containing protein, partial [Gemmataceae bacterium]